VPHLDFSFGGALTQLGGAEVVCEVTGTHTVLGAATSGDSTANPSEFNNRFFCRVV
jgi:hypothetical protein